MSAANDQEYEAVSQAEADKLHLPHGSPWPIVIAIAITFLGLGLIIPLMLPIGIIGFVVALIGWVREDIHWWEAKLGTGEGVGKTGTLLFMSSEIFLFGALFATYFTFKGISESWPDGDIHLPVLKTSIFTAILISSSFTVHKAEKLLHAGDRKGYMRWWGLTILLGAIFLAGQVWEYTELILHGQMLGTSHFTTTFYMITGTHGLHVLGGLVALIIVYIRSAKGQFNEKRNLMPWGAAIYWHFVDLIWLIVFPTLYIIQ